MWGIVARAASSVVGGYFVALIAERMLGVLVTLANDAPNSDSSPIPGALTAVQENFFLLVLIGIVVAFLAAAHVEASIVR